MTAPKVDPDKRQCSPATLASQLGWARGKQFGWSWDKLLDLAERKYYENRRAA